MNILFLGPYRQVDGWGNASRNLATSLTHSKHNVTIQPLHFVPNWQVGPLGEELDRLENNRFDKYDVVIQYALPHYLTKIPNVINIGVFLLEVNNINNSLWTYYINQMDAAWVVNDKDINTLKNSKVTIPCENIPIPIDTEKYSNISVKKYQFPPNVCDNNTFILYYIGSNEERKNLRDIITTYYLSFKEYDNVLLVLKTNVGQSNEISELVTDIQNRLRLYKDNKYYPHIHVINNFLSNENLALLHQTAHCYVNLSHGEACGMDIVDAIGFNSMVITPKNNGTDTYIKDKISVYTIESPVDIARPPIPMVFNGNTTWQNIDVLDACSKLKIVYNTYKYKDAAWDKTSKNNQQYLQRFSFENTAKLIDSTLEQYVNNN